MTQSFKFACVMCRYILFTQTHLHTQKQTDTKVDYFTFASPRGKKWAVARLFTVQRLSFIWSPWQITFYIWNACVLSSSASSPYFSVIISKVQRNPYSPFHYSDMQLLEVFFFQGDQLYWRVIYASIIQWCCCRFLFSAFSCIILRLTIDFTGILCVFFRVACSFQFYQR